MRNKPDSNHTHCQVVPNCSNTWTGLCPNIFYGNQSAACVMVFKQNKEADKKGKVLFVDASDQVRVGRAQNYLEPEHANQIFNCFNAFEDVAHYVKVAIQAYPPDQPHLVIFQS